MFLYVRDFENKKIIKDNKKNKIAREKIKRSSLKYCYVFQAIILQK